MSSEAESPPLAYEFAEYRLEPARRSLTRADGTAVKVAGKPFDLLLYLVRHAGNVVDRSALMSAVWPRRVVEDNNVNQIVAGLRRMLGAQHIVTVAGRGYQFVTPVRLVRREDASLSHSELTSAAVAKPAAPTASKPLRYAVAAMLVLVLGVGLLAGAWHSAKPRSGGGLIAVLPCEDLSPNTTSSHFAIGMHDELLNRLTQIRSLRVASKSAVMRYAVDRPPNRQIGSELGAESIMECGVRYTGNELVLTVQLIDAVSDEHVWSRSYAADLSHMRSVYAIQTDVAVGVTNALRVELLDEDPARSERPPTESTEAFLFYMASFDEVGRQEQLRRLDRALELDPRFVNAWIRKAGTHAIMAGLKTGEESREDKDAAIAAARQAIELDPGSARAHATLAVQLGQEGKWIESELEWRHAVSLARGAPIGANTLQQLAVGQAADAAAAMEEQLLRNRLDQGTRSMLLIAYAMLEDEESRRRHWEFGEDLWGSWMGDTSEPGLRIADKDIEFLRAHTPRHPSAVPIWTAGVTHFDSPSAGLEALRSLYADPAMRSADNLRSLTTWALHFGDPALALQWFREAVGLQATGMMSAWLPLFEPLRREPGFKDLLRDQGLPEYWNRFGNWPTKWCRPTEVDDFECD